MPIPADRPGPSDGLVTLEELQLANRNRGIPLEGLRYDVTPTGMHYLLVHFDIPEIDPATWRLEVVGNVERPLSLTLDDLRRRPARTEPVTLECAGNGRARLNPRPVSQPWLNEAVSTAAWTGAALRGVLDEAGVRAGTVEVLFTGADRGIDLGNEHDYERALPLDEAMRDEVMLVYEMNRAPLEPQHGFPLRLVVPGWYGMTSVKWLRRITALTEPFRGFEQVDSYRYKQVSDEPGEPVTRIRVRALMIPPGLSDFFTRRRQVGRGQVLVRGRAWCGTAPVAGVAVGVDGEWSDAALEEPVGPFAWRGWSFEWNAAPGDHELACRAIDADGNAQPLDQPWNYQGMGNNLVQRVPVTVV